MFRIDKRHVKIAEGQPRPAEASGAPEADDRQEEAATDIREQPSFSQAATELEREARETLEAAQQQADALLEDARKEADQLLAGARTMAEGILGDARQQAEQEALEIRGDAWKAGQAEGREAAQQEALEAGRAQAAELKALTDGLLAGREAQVARLEGDVIELSLAIARKVLGVAIDREDKLFKSMIQNALSQMKREGKLLVRLSGADAQRLFPDGTAVFTLGDERVTVQVTADPYMKTGDAAVESDAETVTAGVESQLAAITVAFEGVAGPQGD